jgi:hypothetical protein
MSVSSALQSLVPVTMAFSISLKEVVKPGGVCSAVQLYVTLYVPSTAPAHAVQYRQVEGSQHVAAWCGVCLMLGVSRVERSAHQQAAHSMTDAAMPHVLHG